MQGLEASTSGPLRGTTQVASGESPDTSTRLSSPPHTSTAIPRPSRSTLPLLLIQRVSLEACPACFKCSWDTKLAISYRSVSYFFLLPLKIPHSSCCCALEGKICTKSLKKHCTQPLCTTLESPRGVRDKIDCPPPGFFGQKRF